MKKDNTILFVDDEFINLDVFEVAFENFYNVIIANSGKEALNILNEKEVQVVITDQKMPDMSGIEFIEKAHAKFPEIIFMLLTAYTDFEVAKKAIENGGVERFLLKPWKVDELKMEIDKAVEKHKLIKRNKDLVVNLENQNQELILLKDKLREELVYLKGEIKLEYNFDNIITKDNAFKKELNRIGQVAKTDSTVLILGETGTGKELVARAVHNNSNRANKPFIMINCAAIPASLIESELFGHEKGAFTGALKQKKGKFELANTGTIFLDEIGELPIELQPKLLRVLQEGEIERVGGSNLITVDIRVIAATNRNLEEEINKKNFRSDLYYRLNVFPVNLPPLRQRKDDIPGLVHFFIEKYNNKYNKSITSVLSKTIAELKRYNWPGNVRELENIVERAVIVSNTKKLNVELATTSTKVQISDDEFVSLEEMERRYILKVLAKTSGIVSGEHGAAQILGLNRSTLNSKMRKLGIRKKEGEI